MMKNEGRERWDIYNKHGEFQNRTIFRGEPLDEGDYHLLVQIWVKNSNGEFLIQQRAETLKSLPGVWCTTAGCVTAGEDSLSGALRELEEEVGIKAEAHDLQKINENISGYALGVAWLLEKDVAIRELTIQEEEVSQIIWASPNKIRRMVKAGTFYDYGDEYFNSIFSGLRVRKQIDHTKSNPSP